MNGYLIPANSKKALLIFGLFSIFDLILFSIGLGITVLLLFAIDPSSLLSAIIDLAPALTCAFLVMPIPNYHNTLTLIKSVNEFYMSRQKFVWKGWCLNEQANKK